MGIYITGPGIGMIVCLTLTNAVLMPWADQDWRLVLRVWGSITLLATVLWFALITVAGRAPVQVTKQRVRGAGVVELLAQPGVRLLMMMGIGVLMITHGLGNWLPELLRAEGMTPDQAGYFAAIPVSLGILGALVIPRLATPQSRYHVLRGLFLSITVGCVCYATVGPGIGVFDFKTRAHQAVVIVEGHAIEIKTTFHIDEDLDAIDLEHLVHIAFSFLEIQLVLKSRTPPTHNPQAQSVFLIALFSEQDSGLLCRNIRNGNHISSAVL